MIVETYNKHITKSLLVILKTHFVRERSTKGAWALCQREPSVNVVFKALP